MINAVGAARGGRCLAQGLLHADARARRRADARAPGEDLLDRGERAELGDARGGAERGEHARVDAAAGAHARQTNALEDALCP